MEIGSRKMLWLDYFLNPEKYIPQLQNMNKGFNKTSENKERMYYQKFQLRVYSLETEIAQHSQTSCSGFIFIG